MWACGGGARRAEVRISADRAARLVGSLERAGLFRVSAPSTLDGPRPRAAPTRLAGAQAGRGVWYLCEVERRGSRGDGRDPAQGPRGGAGEWGNFCSICAKTYAAPCTDPEAAVRAADALDASFRSRLERILAPLMEEEAAETRGRAASSAESRALHGVADEAAAARSGGSAAARPGGWTELWDDAHGCPYWWNEATGESTYEPPVVADEAARSGGSAAARPGGWTELWDDAHGCPYWWNEATGESTYEPPASK
jgi:hypothetical protein